MINHMLGTKTIKAKKGLPFTAGLSLFKSSVADRRARLRESLATGKPLPVDVANDARLRKDFSYDESAEALQSLDDEYETLSGLQDPRVLITTSRSPSSRLQGFSKDLRLLMPTATVINRGTMTLQGLVRVANATGLTDIVHVHEHRGTPSALTISHLPHGPTISFSLHNVKTGQDLPNALRGNISESYPRMLSLEAALRRYTDILHRSHLRWFLHGTRQACAASPSAPVPSKRIFHESGQPNSHI